MDPKKFKTALSEIKALINATEQHFEGFTPFLTVDGKTIQVEGDKITDGVKVLLGGNPGAKVAATDGTYNLEDGTEVIVKDGVIAKFTPVTVVVEPPADPPVVVVDPPAVDPPVLVDPILEFAEEQLEGGSMIFIEPLEGSENEWVGGRVFRTNEDGTRMDEAVTEGEFTLADGKKVIVSEGTISEVIDAGQEDPVDAEFFKALKADFDEFKKLLEKKDEEIKSIKSEFEAYKATSKTVTEKTLELVTEMSALPAIDSPRKKRGIRKDVKAEKERLSGALSSLRKTKN